MKILITGGLGYIGSHLAAELLRKGHEVVAIDDLSNAKACAKEKIERVSGKKITFIKGDFACEKVLKQAFGCGRIAAVMHLAALKAVGESVEKPLLYYSNNVAKTITLLNAMKEYGVKRLVFSSSAAVYGNVAQLPIKENAPIVPVNPYGATKAMVESILRDFCASSRDFCAVALRYFNAAGAHPSGILFEDPIGIPSNLFPYVMKAVRGELAALKIFGNDYDTPDGTCLRDYIHVMDLVRAHIDVLDKAGEGFRAYNVGTGKGCSVLDVVRSFEKASKKSVPHEFAPRRAGDPDALYADSSLIEKELGFVCEKTLENICEDLAKVVKF